MTQKLNPFSGRQFLDANGDPYSGAKLFTYLEGTSTKQTVTKDEAGSSNHTNPIILNSKGEPADVGGSAQAIWQPDGTAIKLVLAPSTDSDPPIAAIASWDNIEGINDTAASGGSAQWVDGTAPTYVNATTFTVTGDQSSTYHVGRRVKTINSGGTIYSTITAVAYTTLTTVTIRNDSGLLDSGLSAVSYGMLSSVNNAIPSNIPTLDNIITKPDVTGGAADAYTVDLKESTYVTGRVYAAQIHADNTGASTISISGLGAKNIKLFDGTDPHAAALKSGFVHYFLYNGTNMVLLNPEITQAGGLIQSAAIDWVDVGTQGDIDQSVVAASAIGQGELKSTTASGSQVIGADSNSTYTLTGGSYSWWTAGGGSSAGNPGSGAKIGGGGNPAAGIVGVANDDIGGSQTIYFDERYIQASPPYFLDDLVASFVFALVDSNGEILGLRVSLDPPWAYHGPTNIMAKWYDKQGRAWRKEKQYMVDIYDGRQPALIQSLKNPDLSLAARKHIQDNSQLVDFEITPEFKNSDMPIMPHWWVGHDLTDKKIVMFDPSDSLSNEIKEIIDVSHARDAREIIEQKYITFDNNQLTRITPPGVMTVKAKWKNTK